jgi:hypothetical protein
LLRHICRITFIVVNAQGLVAFPLVGEQALKCPFLQESVHLLVHVGGRPIDGSVKLFNRGCGHLNATVARLAILQGLNVIAVELKTLQVRKLWGIGEHPERQKAGNLAKAIEIAGILEVRLGSSMDVDRAKQQDLGCRAGREGRRDRLSLTDRGDLLVT